MNLYSHCLNVTLDCYVMLSRGSRRGGCKHPHERCHRGRSILKETPALNMRATQRIRCEVSHPGNTSPLETHNIININTFYLQASCHGARRYFTVKMTKEGDESWSCSSAGENDVNKPADVYFQNRCCFTRRRSEMNWSRDQIWLMGQEAVTY